jgi:cell filamentation protein
MIESEKDSGKIRALLAQALTDRIDDREIFMKGIDYSYYYEQEDGVEVISDGKEDKE